MSPFLFLLIASGLPFTTMLSAEILVFAITHINQKFQAAMQSLSAGVIFAAICTELVPLMDKLSHENMHSVAGLALGFALALVVLFGIQWFTERKARLKDEANERAAAEISAAEVLPACQEEAQVMNDVVIPVGDGEQLISSSSGQLASIIPAKSALFTKPADTITPAGLPVEENQTDLPVAKEEVFPLTLVFAVTLDAFVDGFLQGISFSAAQTAGLILCLATGIEMSFLGLAYASAIRKIRLSFLLRALLIIIPPSTILISSMAAYTVGNMLQSETFFFSGFVGFGSAALLFLVTEELLLEAHENQEGKKLWWVNIWCFVGVLAIIVIELLFN